LLFYYYVVLISSHVNFNILISLYYRKHLLRQTEGGLDKLEENRRIRDEEVRLSIAQEFALARSSLTSTPPNVPSEDSVSPPPTLTMENVVVIMGGGNDGGRGGSATAIVVTTEEDLLLLEGEGLLENEEGLLELADEEIEALERELSAEPPQTVAVGIVAS
jgi:hypothetical protein